MAAHEVQHPRWGSNLDNQLSAYEWRHYGEDGYKRTTENYTGFFGGQKTRVKKKYVGYGWFPTTDDNFAPDDLKYNDGMPIAEVWFDGTGKRRGPLHDYDTSRIVCTFADREQMDQYLDVTNRRMPKSITHQGVKYSGMTNGAYQSDDGSMLPGLLVMYFMLSSDEQQAFAAQNPEVQSLLGDTSSVAATDGASYGDGDQSGGADYGGGGDYGGGADVGGSSDFGGGGSSDAGGGGGP
jgi:hypothetical protein